MSFLGNASPTYESPLGSWEDQIAAAMGEYYGYHTTEENNKRDSNYCCYMVKNEAAKLGSGYYVPITINGFES
jgi:hypothetical protein